VLKIRVVDRAVVAPTKRRDPLLLFLPEEHALCILLTDLLSKLFFLLLSRFSFALPPSDPLGDTRTLLRYPLYALTLFLAQIVVLIQVVILLLLAEFLYFHLQFSSAFWRRRVVA